MEIVRDQYNVSGRKEQRLYTRRNKNNSVGRQEVGQSVS